MSSPTEIRHSMDEQEFRDLVSGKIVELKIDKRIFPNSPTVRVALQDIGYDRIFDAMFNSLPSHARKEKGNV